MSSHEAGPHRNQENLSDVTVGDVMQLGDPLLLAERLTPAQLQDKITEYALKAATLREQIHQASLSLSGTESQLSVLNQAMQLAQDRNPGV